MRGFYPSRRCEATGWPMQAKLPRRLKSDGTRRVRSLDDDLAHHAVIGMGLAVLVDDAATQVGDAPGRHRHEPPFRDLPGIDLDLADGAFELGERGELAVALLDDLTLRV